MKRGEIGLIFFLLLIGLFIRLYNLPQLMPFTYDQGRDMQVLEKVSHGDIILIGPTTGMPGVFLGPFYHYFLLPGFLLGQGSPMGVAIWSALIISLTLPLFYLILKPIVGKPLALLGYVLLLISPGSLQEARVIWNPSLAVMLLLPSIYALFRSAKQPWWLIPSLFFYGLSLQSEVAYTAFLLPAYIGWIVWHWWQPRQSQSRSLYSFKILLISLLAFGLTVLPQGLFELKHDFLMTNALIREMQDSSKKVPFQQIWEQRPEQMVNALNQYIFGNAPGSSWMLLILMGLIVWSVLRRPAKPEYHFFLALFLLPLGLLLLFRGNYGFFFNYYLSPHYLLFIATLIVAIKFLPHRAVLTAMVILMFGYAFFRFSPLIFNRTQLGYTITHEIKAMEKARELANEQNIGVEVFVPNLLPVQYEYLNGYLAKKHHRPAIAWNRQADANTWLLLWEPAFAGGSEMAFNDWVKRNKSNAECKVEATYGIITLEKCTSLATQ